MFYLNPTKRGVGVELWGTSADLRLMYQVFSDLWDLDDDKLTENILSAFLYEVRHADQGDRLIRENSHFSIERESHFGCQISWVQLLYFIAFVNHKKSLHPRNKLLDAIIFQLEYWTEEALVEYDGKTGQLMLTYVGKSLDGSNPHLYYFMRLANLKFFELKGGKRAFHQLPELMKEGVKGTVAFKTIRNRLILKAKELGCDPGELDLDEDDAVYDIQW
ncbi:hypothetical protein U3A58_17325 [Algoriphagus sp. C2-6-M1]|uniref:DUF6904 family protein n=1 Tax=Algoriphagus persicinus TaxID=3108754 RepID=UPI002B384E1C|nr:hypothetical protein [Algoriphagus sp. C2-6-M1]MEB2782157.1 hypothetical protein [Algoriphagus sp. C2-6-M1]